MKSSFIITIIFCWFQNSNLKAQTNIIYQQPTNNTFRTYTNINLDKGFNSDEIKTQGARFLIDGWCTGRVMLSDHQNFTFDSSSLNFDKLERTLVVKMNDGKVISIPSEKVIELNLHTDSADLHFINLGIENGICLSLLKNIKYSLYKKIITREHKPNYQNNGFYESGTKDITFVDEAQYIIYKNGKELYNIGDRNSKKLKELLNFIPKSKDYLSSHNFKLSEAELIELVNILNK